MTSLTVMLTANLIDMTVFAPHRKMESFIWKLCGITMARNRPVWYNNVGTVDNKGQYSESLLLSNLQDLLRGTFQFFQLADHTSGGLDTIF
jgi:hypothetical protein